MEDRNTLRYDVIEKWYLLWKGVMLSHRKMEEGIYLLQNPLVKGRICRKRQEASECHCLLNTLKHQMPFLHTKRKSKLELARP